MSIETLLEKLFGPKEQGNQQTMMGLAAFNNKKGKQEPKPDPVKYSGDIGAQQNFIHAKISKQKGQSTAADQN